MFTGLIEAVGAVTALTAVEQGRVIAIDAPFAAELQLGDSVSVNGVCLTVTALGDGGARFDVGSETLRVTTLGRAAVGDRVNLERAMRGDSRFGGHFVQGHVDGDASIVRIWEEGESWWLTLEFGGVAAPYLIAKGAVALDGISLTVAALRDGQFDVMIVPFTWQHTNLPTRRPGDRMNIEYDMVGKYVARAASLAGLTRQP